MKTKLFIFLIVAIAVQNSFAKEMVSDECKQFLKTTKYLDDCERVRASSHLSHSLIWENDSFLPSGTDDRHYTNGMKLSWTYNPCRVKHRWIKDKFNSLLSNFSGFQRDIYTGGLFGMNMYTPNDITNTIRNLDDRPYVGWMYGGFAVQSIEEDKRGSSHALEIQIGAIGPVAGQEEIQTYFHKHITDSDEPLGWDNQISDRFGINALYMYRTNYYPFGKTGIGRYVRFAPHVGLALGNVANFVNTGGMFIIGKSGYDMPSLTIQPTFIKLEYPIKPPTYKPSQDLKPPLAQPKYTDSMGDFISLSHARKSWKYYLYAGVDLRYYASNIFVEGKGDAKHNIDLVRGVYDVMAGFSVKPGNRDWKISYKMIHRSQEFNSNNPAYEKSHKIGQMNFEWYF